MQSTQPTTLPPGTPTQGLLSVQQAYVERHSEAVVEIGGKYYTPAIPAQAIIAGGATPTGQDITKMREGLVTGIKESKLAFGTSPYVAGEGGVVPEGTVLWGAGWTKYAADKQNLPTIKAQYDSNRAEIRDLTDQRWAILGYSPEEIAEAHKMAEAGQAYLVDWADRAKALAKEDPTAFKKYQALLTEESSLAYVSREINDWYWAARSNIKAGREAPEGLAQLDALLTIKDYLIPDEIAPGQSAGCPLSVSVDVRGALQGGVDPKVLEALNIDPKVIADAQQSIAPAATTAVSGDGVAKTYGYAAPPTGYRATMVQGAGLGLGAGFANLGGGLNVPSGLITPSLQNPLAMKYGAEEYKRWTGKDIGIGEYTAAIKGAGRATAAIQELPASFPTTNEEIRVLHDKLVAEHGETIGNELFTNQMEKINAIRNDPSVYPVGIKYNKDTGLYEWTTRAILESLPVTASVVALPIALESVGAILFGGATKAATAGEAVVSGAARGTSAIPSVATESGVGSSRVASILGNVGKLYTSVTSKIPGYNWFMKLGVPTSYQGGIVGGLQRAGVAAMQAMKIPTMTTGLVTPPTLIAGAVTPKPEKTWEETKQQMIQDALTNPVERAEWEKARQEYLDSSEYQQQVAEATSRESYDGYINSPEYRQQVADMTSQKSYQDYLNSPEYKKQVAAIEAEGNMAITPTYEQFVAGLQTPPYEQFAAGVREPTLEDYVTAAIEPQSEPMSYQSGLAGIIGRGSEKLWSPVMEKLQGIPVVGGLAAGGFGVLNPYPVMASLYPEKGALSAVTMFPYYGPITGTTALTWKESSVLDKILGIGFTVLPAATPLVGGAFRAVRGEIAFPKTTELGSATDAFRMAQKQYDALVRGGATDEFIISAKENLNLAQEGLAVARARVAIPELERQAVKLADEVKAAESKITSGIEEATGGKIEVSPKTVEPIDAVWQSRAGDVPVKVTGMAGEVGGVKYYKIEGSQTALPETELSFSKPPQFVDVGRTLLKFEPEMTPKVKQLYENYSNLQGKLLEVQRELHNNWNRLAASMRVESVQLKSQLSPNGYITERGMRALGEVKVGKLEAGTSPEVRQLLKIWQEVEKAQAEFNDLVKLRGSATGSSPELVRAKYELDLARSRSGNAAFELLRARDALLKARAFGDTAAIAKAEARFKVAEDATPNANEFLKAVENFESVRFRMRPVGRVREGGQWVERGLPSLEDVAKARIRLSELEARKAALEIGSGKSAVAEVEAILRTAKAEQAPIVYGEEGGKVMRYAEMPKAKISFEQPTVITKAGAPPPEYPTLGRGMEPLVGWGKRTAVPTEVWRKPFVPEGAPKTIEEFLSLPKWKQRLLSDPEAYARWEKAQARIEEINRQIAEIVERDRSDPYIAELRAEIEKVKANANATTATAEKIKSKVAETKTKIEPSTLTEIVGRSKTTYQSQITPTPAQMYVWYEQTPEGLWIRRQSMVPHIGNIPAERSEITEFPEITPSIVTTAIPGIAPEIRTIPRIGTEAEPVIEAIPSFKPAWGVQTGLAPVTEMGLETGMKPAFELKPAFETAPAPSIYTPPPSIYAPPYTPPPIEEAPPPTRKFPPLWWPGELPPLVGGGQAGIGGKVSFAAVSMKVPEMVVYMPSPKLLPPKATATLAGKTVEKHGTHSTYVGRPEEILETEYSLEEWMAKKPSHISEKQWRELGRISGGVELMEAPEEDELEMTPFGLRSVKTVTERAYLKGGAKRAGLGTLDIETGKPAKQKVSSKMSKRQARRLYEHGGYDYIYTSQPEAQALAQATGVE